MNLVIMFCIVSVCMSLFISLLDLKCYIEHECVVLMRVCLD